MRTGCLRYVGTRPALDVVEVDGEPGVYYLRGQKNMVMVKRLTAAEAERLRHPEVLIEWRWEA